MSQYQGRFEEGQFDPNSRSFQENGVRRDSNQHMFNKMASQVQNKGKNMDEYSDMYSEVSMDMKQKSSHHDQNNFNLYDQIARSS